MLFKLLFVLTSLIKTTRIYFILPFLLTGYLQLQIYSQNFNGTTHYPSGLKPGNILTIGCISPLTDVTVVLTCPGGHMSRGQSVTSLRDVHVTREWDGGRCTSEVNEAQENVYLVQSTLKFNVYCK